MRILFVTATYLPTSNGVTYHVSSTAQALRKLGHTVYILAPFSPGYTDSDKYIIRYPSLPNPFIKKYPLGVPFFPIEKIKRLKPDVVHTHHPLISGQFAAQVAEKLDIPLFFTAHTQYEQYLNYYFPQGFNFTSKIIIGDLQNIAKKSKRVICPSINTQLRLIKHNIKNTVVINNGVENHFLVKPSKKSFTQPTLAYTGRLDMEKNPLQLVKISKELKRIIPNFRLLIIGTGLMFKKMFDLVIKSNLQENIIFTGEINRLILPQIYKSVHLFITPSISEVMPISILEAMASGIPIIGVEKSGLEEIIINGKTGFIIKNDSKKIAKKIAFVLSNSKNYYNLSLSTYQHALNFSSVKTAQKLVRIYRNAV
ncbi:MAG: glycosyltransferase [Patescibacteria group bacterium]